MGITMETSIWEPNRNIYLFFFFCCIISIFVRFFLFKKASNLLDSGLSRSFIHSQRNFLFMFSMASAVQNFWPAFGELELVSAGLTRKQMVAYTCVGYAVAMIFGPVFAVLSDSFGHRNVSVMFWVLHLFTSVLKRITGRSSSLLGIIFLSIATSIFSFNYDAWVAVEHEKIGYRNDVLSDMFWLMTFYESASFIGSQAFANWSLSKNTRIDVTSSAIYPALISTIGIIFVFKFHSHMTGSMPLKDYWVSFSSSILADKRILLLLCAQASLQFSVTVFGNIWAPTIVADGREVRLGLLYPCFAGARMLGSTLFPWLVNKPPRRFRTETHLVYAFVLAGTVLAVTAYDYQDIGTLVTLFCIFSVCVGLVQPSLAQLRTLYVRNCFRGGMVSLSYVPANAVSIFLLAQRGLYGNVENSALVAFSAMALFVAAGCLYVLDTNRHGRQQQQQQKPDENTHSL